VSVLIAASAIRQRMAHFVHELLYHTTNDVFEPRWASWRQALDRNSILNICSFFFNICLF